MSYNPETYQDSPALLQDSFGKSTVGAGIRVRSPLLTKFLLVSFPLGTEMFHFPRFALCIAAEY